MSYKVIMELDFEDKPYDEDIYKYITDIYNDYGLMHGYTLINNSTNKEEE